MLRNLIFETFPRPGRLRVLALMLLPYQKLCLHRLVRRSGLLSRLPAQLAAMHGVMPDVSLRGLRRRIPYRLEARGRQRARVGLLTGCVQRVFFSETNAATVRVLRAEGCEVVTPPEQGCCGALALHAGREKQAQQYARKLIDVFDREGLDYVAVNAAGCGSSMKEYGHLLRDDPEYAERAARFSQRVRDVTELLVELGPVAKRHRLDLEIAYHDACHLAHAQGIRREPRELLEGIPGVKLLPVAEADICCGSAGIYNLVEPGPASELGDRKARHIMQTGARIVASANPGCTLQIRAAAERAGGSLRVMHPVEIVDMSLRGGQ